MDKSTSKKRLTNENLICLYELLTKYKENHLRPLQMEYNDIKTKNEALTQMQIAKHVSAIDEILEIMRYEFY